jgi:hypothetical protein
MVPSRISLKYFVKDPGTVDLDEFIPLFHRWIQNHRVEGLLVDVADYKHVPQGPGMMLIGHEGDYALNMENGQPGMFYVRKRKAPDNLIDFLRLMFRLTLSACHAVETDEELKGKVRFATNEAELLFVDRLRVPNQPESFNLICDPLQSVVTELYGDAAVRIEPLKNDPRESFGVRISAPAPVDLPVLIERMEAVRAK